MANLTFKDVTVFLQNRDKKIECKPMETYFFLKKIKESKYFILLSSNLPVTMEDGDSIEDNGFNFLSCSFHGSKYYFETIIKKTDKSNYKWLESQIEP